MFGGRKELVELLLVGVIAEEFVQFGAGLHEVEHISLRTFAPDGMVHPEGGGIHGAVGSATIEDDVDADGGQLLGGVERSFSELCDVGQDGHAHRLFEAGIHGAGR